MTQVITTQEHAVHVMEQTMNIANNALKIAMMMNLLPAVKCLFVQNAMMDIISMINLNVLDVTLHARLVMVQLIMTA